MAMRPSWSSTCELTTTVMPRCSFKRMMRLRISRTPSGSSPFIGSSSSSTSGEPSIASASLRREEMAIYQLI